MEKVSAPLERSQDDMLPTATSTSTGSSTGFRTRRDRTISRILRRVLIAICFGLVIYIFLSLYSSSRPNRAPSPDADPQAEVGGKRPNGGHDADDALPLSSASPKRVPLEAHIMSKCPDARDCLQQLIVPAMEHIDDKVDFLLSFIAR
jgi:hypothetical protein